MFSIDSIVKQLEDKIIKEEPRQSIISPEHKIFPLLINESYKNPGSRNQSINGFIYQPLYSNTEISTWLNGQSLIIAIKGTSNIKNLFMDVQLINSTFTEDNAKKLLNKVKKIISAFPGRTPIITGHSLGGTKSLIINRYLGIPSITFNSFIPGFTQFLTDILLNSNSTNYTVFGDVLSNNLLKNKNINKVILVQRPGLTITSKHSLSQFF